MKPLGTAVAACVWILVCAYLYVEWPRLAAVLEILDSSIPPWARSLAHLPKTAWLVWGLVIVIGLKIKDRWMSTPTALALDALLGSPAFIAIGFLLYPFVVPLE